MIAHYGVYLSLKQKCQKVFEGETEDGNKIEVYAQGEEKEVIPFVAVVEINPLRPRQPDIKTRENMPKRLFQQMLKLIKQTVKA